MKLYKLTTQYCKTRAGCTNECVWGPGVTHSGTGEGPLCGPGWIHAYTHPLLAVLMNPAHANIENPRLWEAEGEVEKEELGLKVGCRSLTTVREISLPVLSHEQRVRFAILCAKKVEESAWWNAWADKWLSGEDRSSSIAASAAYAAAASAASYVASAAYAAAASAAYVASASYASYAASAAAARAAAAAASAPIDLIALAEEACK